MLIFTPQMALEAVNDKNLPKFFKATFILLKLTKLWLFLQKRGQNQM